MNDFETIQVQSFAQRDRFKRISQRDILPSAVKVGKMLSGQLYSKTNTFTFTDLLTLGNDFYIFSLRQIRSVNTGAICINIHRLNNSD